MNPFDEFDSPKSGGNPFDEFDAPKPKMLATGQQNFLDALKDELKNTDWGTRNIAAMGAGVSNLYEFAKQIFGKQDNSQIAANREIREAAPVGAVTGDLLGPVGLTAMKALPVLSGATGFLPTAAQYAGNVGIGAAAGAGINALNPTLPGESKIDQLKQGAVEGAIGAGLVAPAIQGSAKAAGWLYDTLRGARPDLAAGKIMRDAAGQDLYDIIAANKAAPANITAAQAAAGIDRDTWQALGALAAKNDKESFYRVLADAQESARQAKLAGLAGGDTQTASKIAQGEAKSALNQQFVPRMNVELNAANEGQKAVQYQNIADSLGEAAANKVQDVRRMVAAADRAENMGTALGRRSPATELGSPTGMPSAGKAYSYGQELANRAESEAQKAAGDSLILGEGRRFSEGIAASLDAYGLKPLNADPIVSGIAQKLQNPTSAGNKKYEAVLNRVAQDISDWSARNGGIIDSRALYAIRKNSVNDAVESLTAGMDPKASAKYAAQVLSEVRPMIDQAIVDAGGTAWPQTLKIFEKGMIPIERQKMAARLMDMSKQKFIDTVEGNAPKEVEKIFSGKNAYDIDAKMGGKMRTLKPLAEELKRDIAIKEQAKAGEGGLARILEADAVKFRLPNFLSRPAAVANKAIDMAEKQLSEKTMDRLVKGMRSGADANDLLYMIPTSERENFLNALINNANKVAVPASVR